MPSRERNLSVYRSKFFHFYFICLIGLLSACSSVEVFVENREVPFQKTYSSFVLVNKELGIAGFADPKLDQQVQEALEEQLLASGHSNEDLRQRERVNTLNPYPFWGMRMYDPWLFNPMMRNFRSTVTTTKYALLQVILDVIDPKEDKYLMTLTGVTEVATPKGKTKITLKALEKTTNTFLEYNFNPSK
jgi:hypothetical protein